MGALAFLLFLTAQQFTQNRITFENAAIHENATVGLPLLIAFAFYWIGTKISYARLDKIMRRDGFVPVEHKSAMYTRSHGNPGTGPLTKP